MWGVAKQPAVALFHVVIVFVAVLGMGTPAVASKPGDCRGFFAQVVDFHRRAWQALPVSSTPIESKPALKIMSWNVAQIKHAPHKYGRDRVGRRIQVAAGAPRGVAHTNGLARMIQTADPDVILLQEAESVEEANWFFDQKLGGHWKVVSYPVSVDQDLMQVVAVRASLLAHVDVFWNAISDPMWNDPVVARDDPPWATSVESRLFTRDLIHTGLILRGTEEPLINFLNVHLRSKRNREGDRGSDKLKSAEIAALGRVISEIDYQFGSGVPLVVGGDLNFDLLNESERRLVLHSTGYVQPFDWLGIPLTPKARATQSHERKHSGQMQHSQTDTFLIHPRHRRFIVSAGTLPFLDAYGRPLPLPESGCEVSCLPSDHRAIVLEVANPLLKRR